MEGNESSTSTRSEGAKKLFLGGSKYSWLAMLALWLVFAMNSNFRNFFFLVQPPIIAEFDTDATTMGLIAAIITLAQSVLVLPGSAWSDRGGHGWARKYREIPMALGYMIFSILTGIKGLTPDRMALCWRA
jgi:sugar phosphate permease